MSKADPQRLPDYLRHIVDAIARIQRYVADQVESDFLADERTQDAVVRNVEVIGEAARNVQQHQAGFAAAQSDVPWALMAGAGIGRLVQQTRPAYGPSLNDVQLRSDTAQHLQQTVAAMNCKTCC